MVENTGYPDPQEVRESDEYLMGADAFKEGQSVTDNPFIGETDPEKHYQAWYWNHGWTDALAEIAR